jgi:hypothetical protein
MTKPDVYLCSKPLQYFNIKNIPNLEDSSGIKKLIVIDAFINAKDYVERIRRFDNGWNEVLFFDNFNGGLKWILCHPVHNLFIDNDLSWFLYTLSLLKRIEGVYVYEEGVGSYSSKEVYEASVSKGGVFRDLLRRFLGMGFHPGDSNFCKGVFLTKPKLYNKKFNTDKGLAFEVSFIKNLQRFEDVFVKISGNLPNEINVSDKRILLYVTEWEIMPNILAEFFEEAKQYDICFIKPHPHIKHINLNEKDNIIIIRTPLMCEMILSYLISRGNKLTVWHHYSTSVVHFLDYVESVPLPVNPGFVKVYNEYIKA